jgi:hypothetical protein
MVVWWAMVGWAVALVAVGLEFCSCVMGVFLEVPDVVVEGGSRRRF